MTTNQTTATGEVVGHILRERDSPWMYYDVLILCPDTITITKQYTVNDKGYLPPKGAQIPLRQGKLGFEAV